MRRSFSASLLPHRTISHATGLCSYRGLIPKFTPASIRANRAGCIRRGFFFHQGSNFLGRGWTIRVMLVLGVFKFLVIFFHMSFVLLPVELVLVFR